MEDLIEFFLEIIVGGAIEFSTDEKVPALIRVGLRLIVGLMYGAMVGIIAMIAIRQWKGGNTILSILAFVSDAVLILLIVYMIRKKRD